MNASQHHVRNATSIPPALGQHVIFSVYQKRLTHDFWIQQEADVEAQQSEALSNELAKEPAEGPPGDGSEYKHMGRGMLHFPFLAIYTITISFLFLQWRPKIHFRLAVFTNCPVNGWLCLMIVFQSLSISRLSFQELSQSGSVMMAYDCTRISEVTEIPSKR